MDACLLLGLREYMLPIPDVLWRRLVRGNTDLGFMSKPHHRVRNFVVRMLPKEGKPLSPGFIAEALNLAVPDVTEILDELEQHMTFLFRNEQGNVSWAYPVTTDRTPHRVTLSTGERTYAA